MCLQQKASHVYSFFRREDFRVYNFDHGIHGQRRSQSVRSALFFIHEKIKLHETKDFKAQSALSYFVRWLVHLSFLKNDKNRNSKNKLDHKWTKNWTKNF